MENKVMKLTPEQQALLEETKDFFDQIGAALTGNLNANVLAEQERLKAEVAGSLTPRSIDSKEET